MSDRSFQDLYALYLSYQEFENEEEDFDELHESAGNRNKVLEEIRERFPEEYAKRWVWHVN